MKKQPKKTSKTNNNRTNNNRTKNSRQTKPAKTTARPNLREQILADFATLRVPMTADQLDAVLKQAQDAGSSHLEFLHRLLADQAGLRRQRRIERLIKEANFREALPLSSFDWNFNPLIPRVQIEALAEGDFIRRNQNVVFVGQSGLGKSRLIQSIGLAACCLEQRVHYITSGDLLKDLTAALADQTIHDRVRFYAKFRLLIIDEFGFDRIERTVCPQAASLWYKIIDARSLRASTALITNIDFESWAEYLGDAPLAMALLDRVVDGATIVKLKGKSYRVHRGSKPTK
jgi:DNA replication protein DnaC